MDKHETLKNLSFGERIAENEGRELSHYFVETDQWRSVYEGHTDIIYGPKGSGKSAIYNLLLQRSEQLFDRNTLIKAAENPRGQPAFKELQSDPPTSELEFVNLWKIYLLCVTADTLIEYGINNSSANKLIALLRDAKLLAATFSLHVALKSALDYVRRLTQPAGVEAGIEMDPSTGLPKGFYGKLSLNEPTAAQQDIGIVSVDSAFALANDAVMNSGYSIWLIIDRLDVAFTDNEELETNALRALFRAYLDLLSHECINLKVFLRDDIWRKITKEGFREASHITRTLTIRWDDDSLLNILMRRLLHNPAIPTAYNCEAELILNKYDSQKELFYRVFPDQPEVGERKKKTLDWILSRTADASEYTAPRELIHYLTSLREEQITRFERGQADPPSEALFDRTSLKKALISVSVFRIENTLYAEHPSLKPYIEALEGCKTQQYPWTLAEIWNETDDEAEYIADQLTEIGFFRKSSGSVYWVPFLYRDGLNLSQGSAE